MRTIKEIIVHCTATRQTITSEDIARIWKARGWRTGGYHYIIYPNGECEYAIPIQLVSNGCRGHNANAINVAYVGGIDAHGRPTDNRTAEQTDTMVLLLMQLKAKFPTAQIIGHREIWGRNPTQWHKMCPCFDVAELREGWDL